MEGMVSAMTIALGGLAILAAERLVPDGSGPVATLVPPWHDDGFARAMALDMPVLDIRWGGRLLVLVPGDRGPGAILRAGLIPLSTRVDGACLTAEPSRSETIL